MREHPIPQDVTGYKFHIIGSMTLKQFAELGLGVFLAILFYSSNLFFFIKWPLVAISVGLGVMMAFVPVAERPLDHWLITFFKILYKPTKFFWKRTSRVPDAFTYKPPSDQASFEEEIDLTPARKQRVKEFFTSINNTKPLEAWEIDENTRINSILESFGTVKISQTNIVPQKIKPNLGVRIRKLKKPNLPETIIFDQNNLEAEQQRQAITNKIMAADQVANQIQIPKFQTIEAQVRLSPEEKADLSQIQAKNNSFIAHAEQDAQNITQPTQKAIHNIKLPFPSKPKEPNKIVGMVLSPDNKLITSAIVEIKNLQGNIVRAVKTNPLGQFFITTALGDGQYIVDVEKDGLNFKSLHLELVGEIIDPIEIRSS